MGQKSTKKKTENNNKQVVDKTRLSALETLPQELIWHCKQAIAKDTSSAWTYQGSDKLGYFTRDFPADSDEFSQVKKLLSSHLSGGDLPIKNIHGIYNPGLVANFASNRKLFGDRANLNPWKLDWKDDDKDELRSRVYDEFLKKVESQPWNNNSKVPVLATVHGTGLGIAQKIAKTGFAALASLDSGFYGQGIYFTSSSLYSLPYATLHQDPCLIISFVIPGNVYPTTEFHRGSKSLEGKPVRLPGYHSHYVLTKKDGRTCQSKNEIPFYDEIVVPEEAQVFPAFIVELDNSQNLKSLLHDYQREIPKTTGEEEEQEQEQQSIEREKENSEFHEED